MASAAKSTTPSHSTCRRPSKTSATSPATSPTPSAPPPKSSPCPSSLRSAMTNRKRWSKPSVAFTPDRNDSIRACKRSPLLLRDLFFVLLGYRMRLRLILASRRSHPPHQVPLQPIGLRNRPSRRHHPRHRVRNHRPRIGRQHLVGKGRQRSLGHNRLPVRVLLHADRDRQIPFYILLAERCLIPMHLQIPCKYPHLRSEE